jgi:hypothetical protein
MVGVLSIGACFFSGCWKKEKPPENMKVPRLYLEGRIMSYGAMTPTALRMPKSGTMIEVIKEPLINEFEVVNAELVEVDLGMALLLQLSERGARALYRASVTENGNRIVLVINGNPIGFRRLDGPIADGNFYCFLEMRNEALGDLVLDLKDSIFYLQNKAERPR